MLIMSCTVLVLLSHLCLFHCSMAEPMVGMGMFWSEKIRHFTWMLNTFHPRFQCHTTLCGTWAHRQVTSPRAVLLSTFSIPSHPSQGWQELRFLKQSTETPERLIWMKLNSFWAFTWGSLFIETHWELRRWPLGGPWLLISMWWRRSPSHLAIPQKLCTARSTAFGAHDSTGTREEVFVPCIKEPKFSWPSH